MYLRQAEDCWLKKREPEKKLKQKGKERQKAKEQKKTKKQKTKKAVIFLDHSFFARYVIAAKAALF